MKRVKIIETSTSYIDEVAKAFFIKSLEHHLRILNDLKYPIICVSHSMSETSISAVIIFDDNR